MRAICGWLLYGLLGLVPTTAWCGDADPVLVPQLGHTARAQCMAFSPDGRRLATGAGDGEIILWNARTWDKVRSLTGHLGEVNTVAFSPDGTTLASGSGDRSIILWDVATGARKAELAGHTVAVAAVAFSRDGMRLASGAGEINHEGVGEVFLWDAATGMRLRSLTGHEERVRGVAYSPDGGTLASVDGEGRLILWDTKTGDRRRAPHDLGGCGGAVTFSPDGKKVTVVGSASFAPVAIDVADGNATAFDEGYDSPSCVAYSPDGRILAAGGLGVMLWDTRTHKDAGTLECLSTNVNGVAYSPDGATLAAVSGCGAIIIWDAKTRERIRVLEGHETEPASDISPDGSVLACGSPTGHATLWDLATCRRTHALRSGPADTMWDVLFSPDARKLVALRNGEAPIIWNPRTGRKIRTLSAEGIESSRATWSHDGRTLACGTYEGVARWDTGTGKQLPDWDDQDSSTCCVAYSPDGKLFVSAHMEIAPYGASVVVRDARSGAEVKRLTVAEDIPHSATFSPDGSQLTVGFHTGTVFIWDCRTWQLRKKLEGHAGSAVSLVFIPGTQVLAVGASDFDTDLCETTFWDTSTGQSKESPALARGRLMVVGAATGGVMAFASAEGAVVLVQVGETSRRASLISLEDGKEWLSYTPEGYFACSDGALKYVRWRVGDEMFPAERFAREYRRQELNLAASSR